MEQTLEFSGAAHSAAEHNILFLIPEATAESGMDLMNGGPGIVGTTGSAFVTVDMGIASSTLPFDLSTDAVFPGRALGDDSASLMTSEESDSLPMSVAGAAILTTVGGCINVTSPDNPVGIIIFKNDRANSYVERHAANVYHAMHGEANKTYTYPAVIAESAAGYDVAAKIFGSGSLDKAMETLDTWESILEEHI